MNQLAFDLAEPLARARDPATSHQAADSAKALQAHHQRVILDCLKCHGPCGKDRIAALTRLSGVQVARRTVELERDGLIRWTGRKGFEHGRAGGKGMGGGVKDNLEQRLVRAFYGRHRAAIMKRSDEWGIEPYQWEREAAVGMTPIEAVVWEELRDAGAVMYPQFPVGPYFVDFGNPVAKVAIECDGLLYHLNTTADALRQLAIEDLGWIVWRITGADCMAPAETIEDEHGDVNEGMPYVRRFVRIVCKSHPIVRTAGSDRPVLLAHVLSDAVAAIGAKANAA